MYRIENGILPSDRKNKLLIYDKINKFQNPSTR